MWPLENSAQQARAAVGIAASVGTSGRVGMCVAQVAMVTRWLADVRGRSAQRVPEVGASALRPGSWVRQAPGAAEAPQPQAVRARLGSPLAVGILAGVEPEVRRRLWLHAGAWIDLTRVYGRTLSGLLCNRLSPMPRLHIVRPWLGRSFRWSWLGYNSRMHHSFSAGCGDPTQSKGGKHPKLMHALAISPDLLIRLAKKNDAEEVPRQFAL